MGTPFITAEAEDTDQLAAPVEPLARLGPFRDIIDANLTRNCLREHGIAASILNENLATTAGPIYGPAYGNLDILVPTADLAAAQAVVDDIETKRRTRLDAATPICPHCHQRPTDRVLSNTRWAGVALVGPSILLSGFGVGLFGMLAAIGLMAYPMPAIRKCRTCHKRFTAPVPDAINDEPNDDEPPLADAH